MRERRPPADFPRVHAAYELFGAPDAGGPFVLTCEHATAELPEWEPEPGDRAWLVDLVNGISPFKYFVSIARGVLDTRDLVYFACFCGFFLHANALVLQGRRLKG